jgi:hypothetical protein
MEVTIYTPAFIASENAEVTVNYVIPGGLVNFPKFYIVNRMVKGDAVTLTCRCAMHKLDRPFPVSEMIFDENNEVGTNYVISKIASQIGLNSSFSLLSDIPKLTEKFLKSNNCLLILEKLSEALAGYWRIRGGLLLFVPFEEVLTTSVSVSEHDRIDTGLRKQIRRLVMTGGGETFERGVGEFSQTVCIDTEFASDKLANSVYNRLQGYFYVTLMKTMCKATVFPGVTCEVTFENSRNVFGSTFKINSIKAYPRRSGFYLELTNNAVREDEWDYSGKTEREIKRLNQLFSELEEGGDEPKPEPLPDNEPWKHDSDWALFEAMPHEQGDNGSTARQMNVMVKVISDTRTVNFCCAYAGGGTGEAVFIDWGDGSPIEALTGTYMPNSVANSIVPYYHRKGNTSHTYAENGVYYVRITSSGNHTSALVLPREAFYKNPPLIIGYKLNWGSINLFINGAVYGAGLNKNDNDNLEYGDPSIFFKSKFFQINGYNSSTNFTFNTYTMLYNTYWFDFIQKNYTGITTEEDLEI